MSYHEFQNVSDCYLSFRLLKAVLASVFQSASLNVWMKLLRASLVLNSSHLETLCTLFLSIILSYLFNYYTVVGHNHLIIVLLYFLSCSRNTTSTCHSRTQHVTLTQHIKYISRRSYQRFQ
jgi:hypothetical protein